MRNTLQPLMAVSALVIAAMAGTGLPAAATVPVAGRVATSFATAPMPFERAVAAAVRDAFDAVGVVVEVSRVDVLSANASQRELLAHGRVAIDASGWIPYEVSALYDVSSASALARRLSLGDSGAARPVASTALAAGLTEEASRRLQAEFPGQPATLDIAGVEAREVGNGLLAMEGVGRADFAGEGVAAAVVHALYDPRDNRWLRLQYRLGGDGSGEPVAGL